MSSVRTPEDDKWDSRFISDMNLKMANIVATKSVFDAQEMENTNIRQENKNLRRKLVLWQALAIIMTAFWSVEAFLK